MQVALAHSALLEKLGLELDAKAARIVAVEADVLLVRPPWRACSSDWTCPDTPSSSSTDRSRIS